MKKQWCIPAQYSGEFAARMEDVLEVYALPYEEDIPVVCMDEQPFQLLDEKLQPIAMKPGKPRKEDYEYIRNGVCSIFIFRNGKSYRVRRSSLEKRKPESLRLRAGNHRRVFPGGQYGY